MLRLVLNLSLYLLAISSGVYAQSTPNARNIRYNALIDVQDEVQRALEDFEKASQTSPSMLMQDLVQARQLRFQLLHAIVAITKAYIIDPADLNSSPDSSTNRQFIEGMNKLVDSSLCVVLSENWRTISNYPANSKYDSPEATYNHLLKLYDKFQSSCLIDGIRDAFQAFQKYIQLQESSDSQAVRLRDESLSRFNQIISGDFIYEFHSLKEIEDAMEAVGIHTSSSWITGYSHETKKNFCDSIKMNFNNTIAGHVYSIYQLLSQIVDFYQNQPIENLFPDPEKLKSLFDLLQDYFSDISRRGGLEEFVGHSTEMDGLVNDLEFLQKRLDEIFEY